MESQNTKPPLLRKGAVSVFARVKGLEPSAFPVTGGRSNQLSYTRIVCGPLEYTVFMCLKQVC